MRAVVSGLPSCMSGSLSCSAAKCKAARHDNKDAHDLAAAELQYVEGCGLAHLVLGANGEPDDELVGVTELVPVLVLRPMSDTVA